MKYCKHTWKVIRIEEGKRRGFLFILEDVVIYHLRCSKCGRVSSIINPSVSRDHDFKIEHKRYSE